MIVGILNFVSILVLIYDTTGYIAKYLDKETDVAKSDFRRLVHTWIFYASLQLLSCCLFSCECEGFFAGLFRLTSALLRLYVALPITGGASLFTTQFIDNAIISKLSKSAVEFIKAKISSVQCSTPQ